MASTKWYALFQYFALNPWIAYLLACNQFWKNANTGLHAIPIQKCSTAFFYVNGDPKQHSVFSNACFASFHDFFSITKTPCFNRDRINIDFPLDTGGRVIELIKKNLVGMIYRARRTQCPWGWQLTTNLSLALANKRLIRALQIKFWMKV